MGRHEIKKKGKPSFLINEWLMLKIENGQLFQFYAIAMGANISL